MTDNLSSDFSSESKENSVSNFSSWLIRFYSSPRWEIIYSSIIVTILMLLVAMGTGEIIGWLMNLFLTDAG